MTTTKTADVADAAKKAAAKKPAKKVAAKPAKKKAAGGSKTDIVIKMLTAAKPTTRKAIVEATGWQVDLTALCRRKNMKLKRHVDGTISATPPKQ